MAWKFLVLYTGNLRNSDVIKFPRNRMERGFKVNFSGFNFQNFSQLEVVSVWSFPESWSQNWWSGTTELSIIGELTSLVLGWPGCDFSTSLSKQRNNKVWTLKISKNRPPFLNRVTSLHVLSTAESLVAGQAFTAFSNRGVITRTPGTRFTKEGKNQTKGRGDVAIIAV